MLFPITTLTLQVVLFLAKWRGKDEVVMADYLEEHILKHKFSRGESVPGKPTAVRHVNTWAAATAWLAAAASPPCHVHSFYSLQDSNTLEAMNRVLKSANFFEQVEGLGTVLEEFPRLLTRFSDNARVS